MNTSYRPVTVLLAVPPAPDHSVQLILEGVSDLAPGGAALAAPHLVHAIHLEYQMGIGIQEIVRKIDKLLWLTRGPIIFRIQIPYCCEHSPLVENSYVDVPNSY